MVDKIGDVEKQDGRESEEAEEESEERDRHSWAREVWEREF